MSLQKRYDFTLFVYILLFLSLSGCCNYENESTCGDYDRNCRDFTIEGKKYTWTITSDFNDTIEITYTEKEDEDKNLFQLVFSCPSEKKEEILYLKKKINAFSGYSLDLFIESGGSLSIGVKYLDKSHRYYVQNNTISVKLADFQ